MMMMVMTMIFKSHHTLDSVEPVAGFKPAQVSWTLECWASCFCLTWQAFLGSLVWGWHPLTQTLSVLSLMIPVTCQQTAEALQRGAHHTEGKPALMPFPPQCGLRTLHRYSWYTHASAKSPQSCLTLCDTVNCSLPGSSVCGILRAGILAWAALPSSRGSSPPRDCACVS